MDAPLAVNALEANTLYIAFALLPFAFGAAWALAARRVRLGRPRREAWLHSLAEVGAVVGSVPLLFLGLTSREGANALQLIPLVDLADLAGASPRTIVEQLAGNLFVFAAAGFFLPVRFRIGLGAVAAGALVAAVTLEALQFTLLTGRVVSVDDALMNAAGAVLAALASRPWWRRSRESAGPEPEPGVLRSAGRDWRVTSFEVSRGTDRAARC
ncbi:VanZ like family protein [Glycomyces sambucus]|uniref:VanZ like family protein n=1 Tax=Glycomyces sambucus TaxID=380244 RepID=A0A1G9JD73_9ACTN|nr:VanZ family protein [Glycomyces sambucus]SDL35185.1 VanZ like family protein [Glycomyces sambucus]